MYLNYTIFERKIHRLHSSVFAKLAHPEMTLGHARCAIVQNAFNSGTGSVNILLQSGPVYIPAVNQRVAVRVSDPCSKKL